MKKVNETRWAVVDEEGRLAVVMNREANEFTTRKWVARGERIARVQITEIEEESDDKG